MPLIAAGQQTCTKMSTMATLVLALLLHATCTLSSVIPPDQPTSCVSCCQGPNCLPGVTESAGSNGGQDGLKDKAELAGDKGEPEAGESGPLDSQDPRSEDGERGDLRLSGLPSGGIEGRMSTDGQPRLISKQGSRGEPHQVGRSAFSVFKNSSQTGTDMNDVVAFQVVETNVGSHYNVTTNKFTCQIPGTYVFMFTIANTYQENNPDVELVKDGRIICRTWNRYASDMGQGPYLQSSQSAILQLAAGNQVWLRIAIPGDVVYSSGSKYTSFSGFLLYGE